MNKKNVQKSWKLDLKNGRNLGVSVEKIRVLDVLIILIF